MTVILVNLSKGVRQWANLTQSGIAAATAAGSPARFGELRQTKKSAKECLSWLIGEVFDG